MCIRDRPYWIDTTFANKGIGVRSICKTLDIALADVMAFGDNLSLIHISPPARRGLRPMPADALRMLSSPERTPDGESEPSPPPSGSLSSSSG